MSERIVNVHPKEYKGKSYRSTLEAKTAEILDLMGVEYLYEPYKITLLEGFRSPFQGRKVVSITYTPDLVFKWKDYTVFVEVKPDNFTNDVYPYKQKMFRKYMEENLKDLNPIFVRVGTIKDKEPNLIFYQVKDCRKQLIEALDNHWQDLGYSIEVTPKPTKKTIGETKTFSSVKEAMKELNLMGKPMGAIVNSLTGKKEFVYNYSWKLTKL